MMQNLWKLFLWCNNFVIDCIVEQMYVCLTCTLHYAKRLASCWVSNWVSQTLLVESNRRFR